MITWHEVINVSDIDGEYQQNSFSETWTGLGIDGGTLTHSAAGMGGWFGENDTRSRVVSGIVITDLDDLVCLEYFNEFDGTAIIPTAHSESYSNGSFSSTYSGFLYTFEEGAEGQPEGNPTASCSGSYEDTNWSRISLTLKSYELTTFTVGGSTTRSVNANTTAISQSGTKTNIVNVPTTVMATINSASIVERPTWRSTNYETTLTRGETYRARYSQFGNLFPAVSTVINATVSITEVEETFNNFSFAIPPTCEGVEVAFTNTATVRQQGFNQIITEPINSTRFTNQSRIFLGPDPQIAPIGQIWVTTTESSFRPSVQTEEPEAAPFGLTESYSRWESFQTTLGFGGGLIVASKEISFENTKFIPSAYLTEITENVGGASPITTFYTTQQESPIIVADSFIEQKYPIALGIETVSLVHQHNLALKLDSADSGGGSRYTLPVTGQEFYSHLIQEVIPATGRRVTLDSTYTFFGSNFTRTFTTVSGAGTTTTSNSGNIGTIGNSTSYYSSTSGVLGQTQSQTNSFYTMIGGKLAGQAAFNAGIYTYFLEDGFNGTTEYTEPSNTFWGSNAPVTAYRRLVVYKIMDNDDSGLRSHGITQTEAWNISDQVIDD